MSVIWQFVPWKLTVITVPLKVELFMKLEMGSGPLVKVNVSVVEVGPPDVPLPAQTKVEPSATVDIAIPG